MSRKRQRGRSRTPASAIRAPLEALDVRASFDVAPAPVESPAPGASSTALATTEHRARVEQMRPSPIASTDVVDRRARDRSTVPQDPPAGRPARERARRQDAVLWLAAAAGPVAWFVDHVVAWIVTPPAHMTGAVWLMRLLHVGFMLVPIGAALLALREGNALRGQDSADVSVDRARMMAATAVGLAVLSFVLILANFLPTVILRPGEEP